jgi:hypothetical protein
MNMFVIVESWGYQGSKICGSLLYSAKSHDFQHITPVKWAHLHLHPMFWRRVIDSFSSGQHTNGLLDRKDFSIIITEF